MSVIELQVLENIRWRLTTVYVMFSLNRSESHIEIFTLNSILLKESRKLVIRIRDVESKLHGLAK